MGESSKLFLKTHGSEKIYTDDYIVEYALSATINKSDFILKGTITLTIDKKVVKDEKVRWKTMEKVLLPFSAENTGPFYQQYFGTWTGLLDCDSTEISEALSSISLLEEGEENFLVSGEKTQFILNDETFKLNETIHTVEEISKNESPEVYLKFIGHQGSKIIVMGNIYSLGLFTGIIVKYDVDGQSEQIGNFQFQRK